MSRIELDEINKKYKEKLLSLTKEEIDDVLGFKSKKDRILQFYSINYKSSVKLIKEGILTICYTYKTMQENPRDFNYVKTWVLFCPSSNFEKDLNKYKRIYEQFCTFINTKNTKFKRVIKKIKNVENDFSFFKLPGELFDNNLVYLSTIYYKKHCNSSLNVGLNYILLNQKQSKRIIYLPEYFL